MSAAPRLLSLRLQGFKSFASRTVVEFGPGISAIVGPNGSGKSNLADALRWALGEQGRALRLRKSEDVIFAGSERKSALGMADVTIVLDNSDGLLPVDYRALELGRRLYRSGENDYLLNRQRVRLRDLVDLLDSAHLADNAFLFIGQGMVDQALALRPEERRPLFEEVAGVRRHERRRRRAEEQLAEAETNLARVEDILAELRPQARRLAAQAEQQASRETAGQELAAALIAAAHARWHETARREGGTERQLAEARAEVDRAVAGLRDAETAMVSMRAQLAERAIEERRRRGAHDLATNQLTALRIREAQMRAERAALERDVARLTDERDAAQAELARRRRESAEPVPAPDRDLEAAVAEAARAVADAVAEVAALRATRAAEGEAVLAARRAEAVREAELETSRRRLADAAARAAEERDRAGTSRSRQAELAAALDGLRAESAAVADAERSTGERREAARAALDATEAARRVAAERAATTAAMVAGLRGRLELLEARRAEEETRGIARAARRRGGRRLDDDLGVEPTLRVAVEAALGELARAYLVERDAVPALAGERGTLAIQGAAEARPGGGRGGAAAAGAGAGATAAGGTGGSAAGRGGPLDDLATDGRAADLRTRIAALGGGLLAEAVRHDPTAAVRPLLALAVWLPDLAAVLEIQPLLPPGAVAVDLAGTVVAGRTTVALGRPDGTLERRAEEERVRADLATVEGDAAAVAADTAAAAAAVETARAALDEARALETSAAGDRRSAEERERLAGRDAEAAAREAAWHEAQAERLDQEAARARTLVEELTAAAPRTAGDTRETTAAAGRSGADGLDGLERRIVELRARHDRLALELAEVERRRRVAEAAVAGARAAVSATEERLTRADREAAALLDRRQAIDQEAAGLAASLADATAAESSARVHLDALLASDDADRGRLAASEAAAIGERERLRSAEERSRAAEHAHLQARLELDLVREQVLVELAGLGDLGLTAMLAGGDPAADERPVAPPAADGLEAVAVDGDSAGEIDLDTATLEAALDLAAARWAATPPGERPSPGRLGWLRRRYHELGAANPFAVSEYTELRERLQSLDAQEQDLRSAITATRQLIGELNALIADQFRTTFRALEGAFDARFQQLFGGGFARLSLTDPDDLSSTGVEIVARPPGKKAQALAMLSGGERALTAVALLFAMLEVRPVPFCVLDEVDAALDEANVGRFADALRGLANQTQFIVITHNRGTIEAADALYGVTVGDDSVSRVVSLRLDEATAIAEQHNLGAPGREPVGIEVGPGPSDPQSEAGEAISVG